MISKIFKSVSNRFAQDHQRLLNQDIIAKYIGMLVIAAVTPFAVLELINGRYQYFAIDIVVILVMLQDIVSMRVHAKPFISRYLIVVVFGVVLWSLTYYRGSTGVYWSYPYISFSLFLLRSRSTVIIIFLFLIGMALLSYHTFEGIHAFRVMVTLTTTTIIVWFVSFVVTQQRSSLSKNQEKYKTLVETSLQGLLIVDKNEKPVFANATMAQLLGFDSPEELTSLDSLMSFYHPDESERLTRYTRPRLKNETAPVSYETRWLKKDGAAIWFLANVQMLEWDGEQVAYGVYMDITDRKRAEEDLERHRVSLSQSKKKYEALVETSLQGFLIVNENEKPIFANTSMANMLGFDSSEDLVRLETLESLYPPDESERLIEYTKARLRNEPTPTTYEVKWYGKDGAVVWFLANVQVLEWDGERVAQALYLDITEKRQMEEALRRAQKMDAVGQLTGGIAHDFNNILGIILGNISLLKTEVPAEGNAPKRIHAIEKTAQRAAELTRQLLGISRKKGVDVCLTDINVLIQSMGNLISRSITPEVEVEERLSDNLWLAEIDRSDFEDTLLNLVLNARDAMPNDGRLTIETRNCVLDADFCIRNPEATPGEYVQLSLSDTGTGIRDEELEHIFEPFFTTKPVGKGTGLGLSMVFGFINRSHGHIEVYSEPGIGATFDLYLPRARAMEQDLDEDITDYQLDEIPKGDELILVVDDEPGLLELAQDSLQSQGYRVLVASNGNQALDLLVSNPGISLLFSDVVMPGGVSGYDLAEKATTIHPRLKVLLTSGHTQKVGHHTGEKYNLLKKPYSHEALAYQVRSLLDE